MPKRACLLDIDGTLVDSNDAHAEAWVLALDEHGVHVAFEAVRPLIGMGGEKIVEALAGHSPESPASEAIQDRRKAIFRDRFLPDVRPFPGVRELLERMRQEGLAIVVATSAGEEEVGPLLEKAKVADLIDRTTSSDDAERSKPDPDIVAAAIRRAGVAPADAVMLGDTPYDVDAAKRAGARIVVVRTGGWDFADGGGADAVYDDAADLCRWFETSPFAA